MDVTPAEKMLISMKEAANTLGISRRLLWSLTASQEIPCVRIRSRVLFDPADLRNWIESHKRGTTR
ncbi:MAG: helix-turn-helix domain-containing protein [Planctomycetia bacterium]|nr:helix-turn-helix domain-containing protein [Planctomycetia bacterium]